MYPDRELIRLNRHKAALRRSIGRHRRECATATSGLLGPVAWVDRVIGLWRKFSPYARFAAIPLAFLLQRQLGRLPSARPRLLGTLLRWAPVVLGVVRGFTGARPR